MAIQFNIDAAIEKLGELVTKHGPQAVDLAAKVVQVNAIGNIIQGLISTAFCFATVFGTIKFAKICKKEADKDYIDMNESLAIGTFIAAILCGIASVVLFIIALGDLLDVWSWVAMFDPKLALAHDVLVKFAGMQ